MTHYTSAAEGPISVFIRAQCDGKISSAVLSSVKEAFRTSQKYRLVPTMEDEGRRGRVFAIYMVCAERTNLAAIATTYGQGICRTSTNCGLVIDGSSLKSALCDSYAAEDCGRTLFKTFDDYMVSHHLRRRTGAP
jgi:hypothetical protein